MSILRLETVAINPTLVDEVGKVYGAWTVLEKVGNTRTGKAQWRCRCICGKEGTVTGGDLRKGKSTNCGCQKTYAKGRDTRLKDETGKRYGKYVVIEKAGNTKRGIALWKCRCDCGNERVVSGASLRFGVSVSCGCSKVEVPDETGKRYNRWTVLGPGARPTGRTQSGAWWKCRCDCGTERVVSGGQLRMGNSKSCGCLVHDSNSIAKGEASFNALLGGYKWAAQDRGYEWALSSDEARQLFLGDCFFCGTAPSQIRTRGKDTTGFNGDFVHNGIDRLVNEIGYLPGNCVSACRFCNAMKMDHSVQKFLDHVKKIAAYQRSAKHKKVVEALPELPVQNLLF